ncbi:hypothetical protein OF83DRAFT_1144320 [Amylostereum chailletii]|nr:hypothetical protein OF83DRAFT_1144320 [Amylostereum chailletii]
MASPTLPVIPLPNPLVLLPSARISISVSKAQADVLLRLADSAAPSAARPIVAAVPLISIPAGNSDSDSTQDTEVKLYDWGVTARVVQLVRSPLAAPRPRSATSASHTPFLLTLQGLSRINVPSAPSEDVLATPVLILPVSYPTTTSPTPESIHAFKAAALKLLDRLSHDSAQSQRRRDGWARIAQVIEECEDERVLEMADGLLSAVGAEYKDKLALLSLDPTAVLTHITSLLTKHNTSLSIAQSLTSSLNRQQREHYLRQQLAAVRAELDALQHGPSGGHSGGADGAPGNEFDGTEDSENDPDGLLELRKKIEKLAVGSEERRVGANEWKRLKRIPSASAEWGVVRGYLDWLTSLPWPNSALDPTPETSTSQSHAQLDEDHHGLDRVKRRLVEYLAIVRLLDAQAQAHERDAQARAAIQEQKEQEDAAQASPDGEKALVKAVEIEPLQSIPKTLSKPAPKTRKRVTAKGPILLFIGPPGTGKTSLGASIARALNRPFQRLALGGVRDEGEIRGHRRTYVAAGPGLLVQALRRAGRPDPVILLDEVDKIGQNNFHGDPSAALLEVLDPEQNHAFNDHYMNIPIDLSQVLFICTANTLDTIAPPLLDRCEVVHLSGYTSLEKMHIAKRFLLPKQLERNGLPTDQLSLSDDVMQDLIVRYTREAGVRGLERAIAGVVRWKAVEWAESHDPSSSSPSASSADNSSLPSTLLLSAERRSYDPAVTTPDLENILGIARWDPEERERETRRGIVYGLVVSGMGEGEVMPVESIAVPGRGRLKLTGSLGDVIKESGELALSWVKTNAYELGITASRSQDPLRVQEIDVHLHLPAGAQKKDGPSAGVAITCAFVSLLSGACVPAHIAMTGEVSGFGTP